MPPVEKLRLPDSIVKDCKDAIRALLLTNGWADDESTMHVVRAVGHLAFIYGQDTHVEVNLERTPAHHQITVSPV